MNEAEAKTKWCPFARSLDFDSRDQRPVTINRTYGKGTADLDCMCLGHACMLFEFDAESFDSAMERHEDARQLYAQGAENVNPQPQEANFYRCAMTRRGSP